MQTERTTVRRSTAPLTVPTPIAGDPWSLVADPDPVVRAGLARRPDAPSDVLTQLLADEDPGVRVWAAAHPNAPKELIQALFMRETRTALK